MRKRIELLAVLLGLLCAGAAKPAELLIYTGTSWMDKLPIEVLSVRLKDKVFAEKFALRHKAGEVIEIHEDGFWGDGKGGIVRPPYPGNGNFKVIFLPGVAAETLKYLQDEGIESRKRYLLTPPETKTAVVDTTEDLVVTDQDAIALWNERKRQLAQIVPGIYLLSLACCVAFACRPS